MHLLVATNNPSKLARVRQLLAGTEIVAVSPVEIGRQAIEVDEGSDIMENAERKARAYQGKTDLPILGLDTAFVIPGEDLDPARVRRNALQGRDESTMTREKIAHAMLSFYLAIVARRGEDVPAYWEDAFALLLPDGSIRRERGQRPVILTNQVHKPIDLYFPVRSLYRVVATGKYVADQTPEEELLELQPYQDALKRLLRIA